MLLALHVKVEATWPSAEMLCPGARWRWALCGAGSSFSGFCYGGQQLPEAEVTPWVFGWAAGWHGDLHQCLEADLGTGAGRGAQTVPCPGPSSL